MPEALYLVVEFVSSGTHRWRAPSCLRDLALHTYSPVPVELPGHGQAPRKTALRETLNGSVQFSYAKTTRVEQRLPDLGPPAFGKDTQYRSESIPLGQSDMIEVQHTFRRHSVVLC